MERFSHINRSRLKSINLVSPLKLYSKEISNELKGMKRNMFSVTESSLSLNDECANLYIFSYQNSSIVTSHILLQDVILPLSFDANIVVSVYEYLFDNPLKRYEVKKIMKSFGIKDYYKAKALVNQIVTTSLFIPISYDNKTVYIPYYYDSFEPIVLVIRYLLERAFTITIDHNSVIKAICGSFKFLILCSDDKALINDFISESSEIKKIVVTSKHFKQFNKIKILDVHEFLKSRIINL